MSNPLPSLNALRAFEAAARHLSFSKAAEELNVTTGAVSQQVKALEEYLGVPLFHRLKRGIALTDAGLAGLPHLRQGFNLLSKGVSALRGATESEVLLVEGAPTFTMKWLLPRLPAFTRAHPSIDLRLSSSLKQIDGDLTARDDVARYRAGQINLGVRFGQSACADCRVDELFSVKAVPLCSPSLLEGPNALREPADLRHHSLLHAETSWEGLPDWSVWLDAAGVGELPMKQGPHFNTEHLVMQAAIGGQGVALSLDALAADDIAAGRLVIPFDIRLPVIGGYYLVSLEETAGLARVAAFRDWILEEAERFQSDVEGTQTLGAGAA